MAALTASDREHDNARVLVLIRDSYTASRGVYGARRVFSYLREMVENCGKHRMAELMRTNRFKALRTYEDHPLSKDSPR